MHKVMKSGMNILEEVNNYRALRVFFLYFKIFLLQLSMSGFYFKIVIDCVFLNGYI